MSHWVYVTCEDCLGSGEDEDGWADSCIYCAGEGQIEVEASS